MDRKKLRQVLTDPNEVVVDKALQILFSADEALWKALDEESDRGMVLGAAAYFESFLESCLRLYFLQCKEANSILRPSGALGTASARSECCRALRILESFQVDALKKIFKVRNKIAHDLMVGFENQSVIDTVESLFEIVSLHFDAEPVQKSPRNKFSASCLVLALDFQRRELSVLRHTGTYPELIPDYYSTTDLRRNGRSVPTTSA